MKTRILTGLAALMITFAGVDLAHSQGVGAHLGFDLDGPEIYLGLNGNLPLGLELAGQRLVLNGDFNYYLVDNFDLIILTTNLLYPFDLEDSKFRPYAGAGLALSFYSYSGPDFDFDFDFSKTFATADNSETDFGLSIKGGTEFLLGGSFVPNAEVILLIKDGSTVGFQVGFNYVFGGGTSSLG